MKRSASVLISMVALGVVLLSCGGSDSNTNPPSNPRSNLPSRALVSNDFTGFLLIVNAATDEASGFAMQLFGQPNRIEVSQDKSISLVYNLAANTVRLIDNETETAMGTVVLGEPTDGFVAPDSDHAYISVRNLNQVWVVDLATDPASPQVLQRPAVTTPRRLVLSPDGATLLVFSDSTNDVYVIDTTLVLTDPVAAVTTVSSPDFDHPTWAVFSSDSARAYILSCGAECGGTQARVTVLEMTDPPTPGASLDLAAATIGVLDGGTLYVAGTDGAGDGQLSVVNTAGLTLGPVVHIGDGFHDRMEPAASNKIFVGARTCTSNPADPFTGCLSIFDRSNNTAVMNVDGDVTGIAPVTGRSVVYVIENGEMWIYDSATSARLPDSEQIAFQGKVVDVKMID